MTFPRGPEGYQLYNPLNRLWPASLWSCDQLCLLHSLLDLFKPSLRRSKLLHLFFAEDSRKLQSRSIWSQAHLLLRLIFLLSSSPRFLKVSECSPRSISLACGWGPPALEKPRHAFVQPWLALKGKGHVGHCAEMSCLNCDAYACVRRTQSRMSTMETSGCRRQLLTASFVVIRHHPRVALYLSLTNMQLTEDHHTQRRAVQLKRNGTGQKNKISLQ